MTHKICTKCGVLKSLNQFYADYRATDGKQSQCSSCMNEHTRKWSKLNPDKLKARRNLISNKLTKKFAEIKRRYGIDIFEYEAIWSKQEGKCVLCSKSLDEVRVCVDHIKDTKIVRGLLCQSCNVKLGWYENRREIINRYIDDAKNKN